jgi:hypothetical protein
MAIKLIISLRIRQSRLPLITLKSALAVSRVKGSKCENKVRDATKGEEVFKSLRFVIL